jgi:uncharacterized protein YegP (UPF0339 family)
MAGKYVIEKSKDEQFYFNLKAGNGQVILSSEMYKSKQGCENGIESVRKNSPEDEQYERKESKNGDPYFVLKAKNHEIIGKSEMYSAVSAMENGIQSVKNSAPDAVVEDLTV